MPRICAHLQEVPATKQLAGKKESNQSRGPQITSKPNEGVNQDQKTENKPQARKDFNIWKYRLNYVNAFFALY